MWGSLRLAPIIYRCHRVRPELSGRLKGGGGARRTCARGGGAFMRGAAPRIRALRRTLVNLRVVCVLVDHIFDRRATT